MVEQGKGDGGDAMLTTAAVVVHKVFTKHNGGTKWRQRWGTVN